MDEDTRARFERAVERKRDQARDQSRAPGGQTPDPSEVSGSQENAAAQDARAKSSQKGKVTADKWNQ